MQVPIHRINDPYLASFVLSQGAAFAGCTRLGPKKMEFRFVAEERLHALLRFYWSGEAMLLVPSKLHDALKTLKSRSLTDLDFPLLPYPSAT
jgi:hypothetical protein